MDAGVANFFLLDRCAYDNTPGAKILKTFKFLATGSWFGAAVKRCQCTRMHEPLMLTHVGEDGSVKTDGRQNLLKQSGFYPRALGKAIVQAWQQKGAWQPPIHRKKPPIEDPWSDPWGDAPLPTKKQKTHGHSCEAAGDPWNDPWGEQSTSADDPWADMLGW